MTLSQVLNCVRNVYFATVDLESVCPDLYYKTQRPYTVCPYLLDCITSLWGQDFGNKVLKEILYFTCVDKVVDREEGII